MCGEQAVFAAADKLSMGSPPRVRGTVHYGFRHNHIKRITPACAGNSTSPPGELMYTSDHPRVCGEQLRSSLWPGMKSGSPPRVRGTVGRHLMGVGLGRITPACAGNSLFISGIRCIRWDHPRVCGEQISAAVVVCGLLGSPPRVRGTVLCILRFDFRERITPACAGNSVRRTINYN